MQPHQDWTEVVITKNPRQSGVSKQQQVVKAQRAGHLVTEKKFAAGENKSAHSAVTRNTRKIEEETEQFKHERVDASLAQAMQQGRLAKKLTQRQLATMINEKPSVIAEYESGRAIPNPQIISKIERALGVHLPRAAKKRKAPATTV